MSRISDLSPAPPLCVGRTHAHARMFCIYALPPSCARGWVTVGGNHAGLFTAEHSIAGSRNLYRRSTTSDPGWQDAPQSAPFPPHLRSLPCPPPRPEDAAKISSGLVLNPRPLLNSFVFRLSPRRLSSAATDLSPSRGLFFSPLCFSFSSLLLSSFSLRPTSRKRILRSGGTR